MSTATKRWGWGLIGPGRFARKFAAELTTLDRVNPIAIGSRNLARAETFAHEFGFARSHGSYEALIHDPEVEIVYIALPHVFHREVAELALRAGKAVLCEKPLTPSAAETRFLCNLSKQKNVFLMEAMKTGFLPAVQQTKKWLQEGAIGEPKLLKADFNFTGSADPADRLMNPQLAGGCILDIGIYPLYLSRYLLGKVNGLQAFGHLTETGVEDTAVINLKHDNGAHASLTASFQTATSMEAVLLGTEGSITLPLFHAAREATLITTDGKHHTFHDTQPGMLTNEIQAVMAALDQGLIECPGHTHADAIELAELMDEALHQIHPTRS